MTDFVDLDALWKVAVLSAAFGAGIVGLYALGLRALATGDAGEVSRGRRAVGYVCFGLCLLAVIVGIRVMLDK